MDLRALEIRLENWARAQRSSGYAPATACSAEGMFRSGYRESRAAPDPVDHADALTVNNAWQHLMRVDQDVLKMHYVRRASPMVILRQLNLIRTAPVLHDAHARAWLRAKRVFLRRHRLSHDDTFDQALYHAQYAIAQRLAKIEGEFVNGPDSAYTPRRLPIPA